MKSTPRSGRRRSTARAASGFSGGPQMPGPVMRMAPKPRRVTSMSPPIANVPDAIAVTVTVTVVTVPTHRSDAEPLEVQQPAQHTRCARVMRQTERPVGALALVVDEHPHERV